MLSFRRLSFSKKNAYIIYLYYLRNLLVDYRPSGTAACAPKARTNWASLPHTRSSSFWFSFHAAHFSLQVCIVNPLEKGSRRESSCHAAIRHLERGTRARLSSLFFFIRERRLLDKADRPKGKDVVDKGDLVGRSLCLSKDWQCVVKGKPRMDWSLILLFFLGLLSISQLPLLEPTLPAGGMIPIFESNLIFRLQVRATGGDTFDLPPVFLSSGFKRMLRLMVSTCTTEEGAGGEALRRTRSS